MFLPLKITPVLRIDERKLCGRYYLHVFSFPVSLSTEVLVVNG
jgi:hypothetical protein